MAILKSRGFHVDCLSGIRTDAFVYGGCHSLFEAAAPVAVGHGVLDLGSQSLLGPVYRGTRDLPAGHGCLAMPGGARGAAHWNGLAAPWRRHDSHASPGYTASVSRADAEPLVARSAPVQSSE